MADEELQPDVPETDEPSLRDSLAEAFDSSEPEGGEDAPLDAGAAETDEGKVRDPLGRFVSKDGSAEGSTGKPAAGQPAAPPQAQTDPAAAAAPVEFKAPASWTPAAREHWQALPPQVREEVARREHQVQTVLSQTAGDRQLAGQFKELVQPYIHLMEMEGAQHPLQAVKSLLDVGRTMRMGTPTEKATLLANVVRQYGVDIAALDSALAGVPMPQQAQQPGFDPRMVDALVSQRLQPIMQAAQQAQAMKAERSTQEVRSSIEQFAADPQNKFFDQVREQMADVMDVAEMQGRKLTLQEAYEQACYLHPEVRKAIIAGQQGATLQQRHKAAQRARSAAVSVRGAAPVGSPSAGEPSSTREAIEAAIEAHTRY